MGMSHNVVGKSGAAMDRVYSERNRVIAQSNVILGHQLLSSFSNTIVIHTHEAHLNLQHILISVVS